MSRPSLPRFAKVAAAVVSVGVLAFGAKAISQTDSPSSASAAGVARAPSLPTSEGGTRGTMPPGMGADVTGATLSRLTSVVTARYPGTVERAMKLPDGSYVVHVIRSNGSEVHVLVSSDFRITGGEQGRWGGHGPMPGPGTPPQGAMPGGGAPPAGGTAPSTSGSTSRQ